MNKRKNVLEEFYNEKRYYSKEEIIDMYINEVNKNLFLNRMLELITYECIDMEFVSLNQELCMKSIEQAIINEDIISLEELISVCEYRKIILSDNLINKISEFKNNSIQTSICNYLNFLYEDIVKKYYILFTKINLNDSNLTFLNNMSYKEQLDFYEISLILGFVKTKNMCNDIILTLTKMYVKINLNLVKRLSEILSKYKLLLSELNKEESQCVKVYKEKRDDRNNF